jgi:autotransporter-associated beta strand protein
VLTANNSYSGASMTVSAGTLVVSGSIRQFGCNPQQRRHACRQQRGGRDYDQPRRHFHAGRDRHPGTITVAGKPRPLRRRVERMRGANSST